MYENYRLDDEEKEILSAYEAGKLRRVKNHAAVLAAHRAAAQATHSRRMRGDRDATEPAAASSYGAGGRRG